MEIEKKWKIGPGKLKLTKPTFFSRMTDKRPSTVHDEYWHVHTDTVNATKHVGFVKVPNSFKYQQIVRRRGVSQGYPLCGHVTEEVENVKRKQKV